MRQKIAIVWILLIILYTSNCKVGSHMTPTSYLVSNCATIGYDADDDEDKFSDLFVL
jgi:hypothetical protein